MGSYSDIIKKKIKDWNYDGLMQGANVQRGPKIPFSSPLMNWATYGGVPRRRITEFFGDPGGGKSTTAIDICKNAISIFEQEHVERIEQLQIDAKSSKSAAMELEELVQSGPKKILYIDLEHGFDNAWASTLGIKDSVIDIMQPPDVFAEDVLQMILEIVQTGEVGLIVLDSLPSLTPKTELEKKIGEKTVAALAGLLNVFCKKVVPLLTRYDSTLLFINQTRDNMDNPYVVQTPGGRAPKFYASLRILFQIGQPVDFLGNELPKNTDNPAGYIVNAKLVKQKSAPWDRKNGSYFLMCQSGIRADMDFAQLATKRYGIIRKGGAWFTLCDPTTGEILDDGTGKAVKLNGMAKVYEYLQNHTDYYEKLKTFIMNDINGRTDADEEVESDGNSYETL